MPMSNYLFSGNIFVTKICVFEKSNLGKFISIPHLERTFFLTSKTYFIVYISKFVSITIVCINNKTYEDNEIVLSFLLSF